MTDLAAAGGVRPMIATGLTWIVLVTIVTFACAAGLVGPYIAMLAVLLSLFVAFDRERLGAALWDWSTRSFLAAYVLLAVAFTLTMREPSDLLAAADFTVLLLALPAYALLSRSAGPDATLRLAWLALAGTAVGLIFGIVEVYVLGAERGTGGFSSIFYADLGVMLGFLALAGFFAPGSSAWRWLLLFGPLLGSAMMYLGGSRGALLAYAALAALFIVFAAIVWRNDWRKVIGAIALVAIAAVLPPAVIDASRVADVATIAQDAATEGVTRDVSTNYRLEFYRAGFQAFLDSPIAGHGWWRRVSAAIPYMNDLAAGYERNLKVAHLHNDLINFGSAAGVIGILAYLLMLVAPMAGVWRSPRDGQFTARLYSALGLAGGLFVMGLTDSMFVYELPKTFFVFVAVAIVALCRDREAAIR